MSEKVVYVLGAGFSAPFGLPVIANFISLAKDQHLLQASGGPTFERVFEKLNELSRIKNVFAADLSNIEEVLSILEMDSFLGDGSSRVEFQEFIKSVIAFRTPPLKPYGSRLPGNWESFAFGRGDLQNGLGLFVAALHQLAIGLDDASRRPSAKRDVSAERSYSVVSANYDTLLESAAEFVNLHFEVAAPIAFRRLPGEPASNPILAKLHGTVDGGDIVPPTWSKGSHPGIAPRWQLARESLSNANHVRFLGYSLPEADAYVRYLLKFSMLSSEHLKTVDVMCLDPQNSVRERYKSFVSHPNLCFASVDLAAFFRELQSEFTATDGRNLQPTWRYLEQVHQVAMRGRL